MLNHNHYNDFYATYEPLFQDHQFELKESNFGEFKGSAGEDEVNFMRSDNALMDGANPRFLLD